jgi:hypothetical protein
MVRLSPYPAAFYIFSQHFYQVTNEVLAGIKIIKLYAWERSFQVRPCVL